MSSYLLRYLGSHKNIVSCYGYCRVNSEVPQLVFEPAVGSLESVLEDSYMYPNMLLILQMSWIKDISSALKYMNDERAVVHGISSHILVFDIPQARRI